MLAEKENCQNQFLDKRAEDKGLCERTSKPSISRPLTRKYAVVTPKELETKPYQLQQHRQPFAAALWAPN